MGKIDFNNLNDLNKFLEQKIKKSLTENVANEVKETMRERVIKDVYSYQPNVYARRGGSGGLSDIKNMKTEVISDDTIVVSNETSPNFRYGDSGNSLSLAGRIVKGEGYLYSGEFDKPRPFIGNTRDELEQTKSHVKAMKEGLEAQGIKVEK